VVDFDHPNVVRSVEREASAERVEAGTDHDYLAR